MTLDLIALTGLIAVFACENIQQSIMLKVTCLNTALKYDQFDIKHKQFNTGLTMRNIDNSFISILLPDIQFNGPFLTVNQSMCSEVEVANQQHCRAHNNLFPTLHKKQFAFCLSVDPGMNRKR